MRTFKAFSNLVLLLSILELVNCDFFETYLNQKRFGPNPGPCANYDDCVGDLANVEDFPDSIKNLEVCLTGDALCQTIEEWVESGIAKIWELECEDLAVDDIELSLGADTFLSVPSRLFTRDVEQKCRGKVEFDNVVLTIRILFTIRVTVTTKDCCSANGGIIWTSENTGSDDALNLDFDVDFNIIDRPATAEDETLTGFSEYVVNEITVDDCAMDLNLGLAVFDVNDDGLWDELSVFGINIGPIVGEQISSILIALLEGLFGATVCGLIEQVDYLNLEDNSGPPGILNELVEEANVYYDTLKAPVSIPGVDAQDQTFAADPIPFGVSTAQLADSFRFDSSLAFETLSVSLNDFLGGADDQGNLAINEAINLLTEPDGEYEFDSSGLNITLEIPISVANVSLTLESVAVEGLNKIKTLKLLDNNFGSSPQNKYTVNNSFVLDSGFKIKFEIGVVLKRGSWVTASTCGTIGNGFSVPGCDDTERFTFTFGVTTSGDFEIDASILTAFNLEEIQDTYLGQVLNEELSSDLLVGVQEAVKCVAPAIYQLNFTDLSARLGGFNDPVVEEFSGQGLSQLIATSTDLIGKIFIASLDKDLPNIVKGPVRNLTNEFLKTEVADITDLSGCAPFTVQPSSRTDYLKFNEFPLTEVFTVINKVLGNTEPGSSVDINAFLQILLDYFSGEFDSFPLEKKNGIDGDWILKPEYSTFFTITPYRTAFQSGEAYIRSGGLEILSLNSITTFGADATDVYGLEFNFTIGNSTPDELIISFNLEVKVDEIGIDENWNFSLKFENLLVDTGFNPLLIDYELVEQLKIGQLTIIPCLVSIIDTLVVSKSELTIGILDAELDRSGSAPSSENTDFGSAGKELADELSAEPSSEFTTMLNTILENGYSFLLKNVEEQDFLSLTTLNCEDEEDTIGDLIDLLVGFEFPNITSLVADCLVDVDKLSDTDLIDNEKASLGYTNSPDELGASYLDFENSIIISIIDFFVGDGGGSGSTLNDVLITIANSTGNPLSDLFILEEDQVTVTLVLPINVSNFVFDLFGIPALSLQSDDIIPGLIFEAQTLKVKGVNKFLSNYQILQPVSTFTTRNNVKFSEAESLDIEVLGLIQTNASFQNSSALPDEPPIREEFSLVLEAKGLEIDLDILFAMNTDKFVNLSVGHFFDANAEQDIFIRDTAVDCLFFSLFPGGFSIPQFRLNISDVIGPEVVFQDNKIISPGLESVINQTTVLLKDFYLDAVPNICQNCLRQVVNDQLNSLYADSQAEGACPKVITPTVLPPEDQIFRFNTSSLIESLQAILEDNFYANNYELWNNIMQALTEDTIYPGAQYNFIEDLGLFYKGTFYGNLTVGVQDLVINGIETFSSLEILKPTEEDSYVTTTSFKIDGPLSVTGLYRIIGNELFQEGSVIVNEPEVEFSFTDIVFGIELYLEVNITKALEVRFSSVSSFEEIPCVLVPVNALELRAVDFVVSNIFLAFDCSGTCDSPLLDSLSAAGRYSSDNGPELAELVASVFNFTKNYLASSPAQDLIDTSIETAEETCAELLGIISTFLPTEEEDYDVFTVMGSVFLGFSFFGAVGIALLVPLHKKRYKKILTKFNGSEAEKELQELKVKSLIFHPAIPKIMKIFIPFICIVNIFFLFIAILFSAAFKIVLEFTVVGLKVNEITLVPFTLVSSINDIWNSGSWYLALLIGVASCAWPIIKNGILLIIFFLPTTILPAHKRAWYLEVLDILGKWSLLDVFVVIMTLAALKTYVVLSQQAQLSFLDDQFFQAEASVAPQRGIILLCVVAASSLIINHIQAYYHNKVVAHNHKLEDKIKGIDIPVKVLRKKEAVWDYKFLPNKKTGLRRIASRRATRILLIINIASGLIVLGSTFLPLIKFDVLGIIGLFLELIDQPLAKRQYTLFDLGTVVQEAPQETFYDSLVIVFFQTLYFLTSLVFPFLMMCINSVLLVRPFNLREHKTFMFVAMIISFWAALECFMVGVVVTVLEIERVTLFIVDFITEDICSSIEGLLIAALGETDGNCLNVFGSLEYGAVPLISSVFIQLGCSTIILVFSNAVIQDRYFRRYYGKRDDAIPPKAKFAKRKIISLLTIKVKSRDQSLSEPGLNTSRKKPSSNGAVMPTPIPNGGNSKGNSLDEDPFPILESVSQNPGFSRDNRRESVDDDFF